MDPMTALAAASSITSLVQFSGTVLSEGYGYIAKVARAPKELRLLLNETATLNTLLDQLQLLVENDSKVAKTAVFNLEETGAIAESRCLLQTVNQSIAACQPTKGHSAKNFGKRLLWPFKEKETKELMQRFHVVRDNFTSALSIDATAALRRIELSSIRVEDEIADLKIENNQRRMEEALMRLEEWLIYDSVHPEENYEAALTCRQPGTSLWFLQHPSFLDWLSRENGLMWVYGIPGCGKTILSSTIIEHLQVKICKDVGLVYFYCDHQDPKKQTLRNFVGVGLSQLLEQAPQCVEDAKELYIRKRGESGGKPTTAECLQLLKSFTLRFATVYMIVDALDECIEVEAFMTGLNELRVSTASESTARVLFTSRQEVQIERQMAECVTHSLCLTNNVEGDIRRFITDQVQARVSSGKLKFRDPKLQDQIVAALCTGADGMFLWAKIQLERICRLRTDRDIRKSLGTLPSGLDATFIRILEQIQAKNPEAMEEIKKVFQWVIGAFIPLPLKVIAEAISIQPEDTSLDQDGIANDLEDIIAMCGSLVIVDKVNDNPRVALAHFSIEEFMQSDRIRQSSVAFFHMVAPDIHMELAKICVQYLSFSDFEAPCPTDRYRARVARYKLFVYASQNWIKHLNASQMDSTNFQLHIMPHLQWFIDPSPGNRNFQSWTQCFMCTMPRLVRGYGRMQRVPSQSVLFYAFRYGIDLVLDRIFPRGAEVNQRFWDGMTPLHLAAYSGHRSGTQRLLEAGAETDVRTDYKRMSPLHIAAERGNLDIVKILLTNNADPHARSRAGTTPFYRAPRGGFMEVLEVLWAHGSDIGVRTKDNFTPLHEAVMANQLAMVERLVEWGADTEVRTQYGQTPLSMAEDLRLWDIARVLSKLVLTNATSEISLSASNERHTTGIT